MTHDSRSKLNGTVKRRRLRVRRPETGDTLIEVLLAVVVLGIASVGILLAFSTSIFGSSQYKGDATTDTVLRTAAEEVTNALQTQSTPLWANCGGVGALQSNVLNAQTQGTTSPVPVPTGYLVSAITATYWNGSTFIAQPSPGSCPTGANGESLLVTVTITTNGNSYSIGTIVDDPSAPPTPAFQSASQVVFIGQPGNGTAGNALSPPPEVAIEDADGNIVTSDLSGVELTLNAPSDVPNAALSPGCGASGVEIGGVVTFSNCSVNDANQSGDGGYTLTASDTGDSISATPATSTNTSAAFTISAGTPSQLAFTNTAFANASGGIAFPTQPQVTVEDAASDPVTNDNSNVTLSILLGSGTGALSGCTVPGGEVGGVFTFAGCAINTKGTTYQLVATDGSFTATSGVLTVQAGSPAGLNFTNTPGSSSSGVAFPSQPAIAIADAGLNTVSGSSAQVTLSISTAKSTGTGTLSGCAANPVTTVNGVATFSGCKITIITEGTFVLSAVATVSGTQYTTTSGAFTVAGGVDHLAFSTTPGASTSGSTFTTQPVVTLVDHSGALVATSGVSIKLSSPGSGNTVGCPTALNTTVTTTGGVATFANCQLTIPTANEGLNSLSASATIASVNYTGTSGNFYVASSATQLVFTTSPGASTTGSPFAIQPAVSIEDARGDLETSNNSTIVTLLINTGNGSIACPTAGSVTAVAVGGIATFSQCQVNIPGNGGGGSFTLKASATIGVTQLTSTLPSASFTVAGTAAKLAFAPLGQPSNGTGGSNLANQPQIMVEDSNSLVVTTDASSVALQLNAPVGVSGASLSDSCAGTESQGVITFAGCSVNQTGAGYTITASDGTLTPVTSLPFNITTGSASQLVFVVSPQGGAAGQVFGVQPVVAVEDAGGNIIATNSTSPVTLTITGGAPMTCATDPQVVAAGVAHFAGCSTTGAGANITLTATSTGFVPAISEAFNITPAAATELSITSPPVSGIAASTASLGPLTVEEDDVYGNPVAAGPSGEAVALTSTSTGTTVFSNLANGTPMGSVTIPYGLASTTFYYGDTFAGAPTISASAPGLATAMQQEAVTAAPPGAFVITSAPVTGVASASANLGPITVQVIDQFGNISTAGTGGQSVALSATGTGFFAKTSGGTAVTNVTVPAGASTVPFYFGDETTGSQTITAAATGITSATQAETITVSPVSAGQSTVVANPTSVTANGTSTSTITVTAKDTFANPVANQVITLSAGSGSSVITTLSGTTNASGVATFSVTDTTAQSVTYTATDTTALVALTTKPTVTFIPGPAAASTSTVVASPTSVNANGTSLSTITVTAKDANGNVVPGNTITLAQGGGASLITTVSGTTNASGVATFTVVDNAAQVVTYTATDNTDTTSFTAAPTVTFILDPASASVSTVVASPTTGVIANGSTPSTITVTVKDSAGAAVANQAISIAHTGSSVVTAVSATTNASGVATFTATDTVAQTVTYTATDTTGAVTFNATPTVAFVAGVASASASTVVANPITGVVANGLATSTITVTLTDASGNPIPGHTITLAHNGSAVITTVSGTTNASGVATFTSHDILAQSVTYTATDTTASLTLTMTPTVTFVAGPAVAGTSSVVASATPILANGISNSTIGVTIRDANSNDRAGDTVTLTANNGTSSVITTVSATTNSNGYASFTVADNTAETVVYTAKDVTPTPNVTVAPSTATVTFTLDSPSVSGFNPKSTVGASPPTGVIANGTATSLITVTIEDTNHNLIANQTITLAHTGSSVVTALSAVTNQSGQATFSVTDTVVQTVTYTATDTTAGGVLTSTATVAFVAGPASASNSTVVAIPATGVIANGSATSTVTVTALDASGNPEFGDTLKLVGTGSTTITPATGVANASGVVVFTVKDLTEETVTYTASDTTDGITFNTTPTVAFVAGTASAGKSTVVASATPITANGVATSTITVTALDANNNPEIGDTITLGQGGGSSLITTVSGTTNSSGIATFTVSDTLAQAVTYTATDNTDGVTITQKPVVTFVPGAVSASASGVVASPTSVNANGTSFSTITVTAKDATNNVITGDTITLAAGSGTSLITTVSGITNGSGQASFTVADNTAQAVVYTATDTAGTGTVLSTKPTVTFNSDPPSVSGVGFTSTVAASPTSGVTANGTSTSLITVTIKDAAGAGSNPISNQTVTLAHTGSSVVTTLSGVTNQSGQATFSVTDLVAETVTYSATDQTAGGLLTSTATVAFVAGPASTVTSTVVASSTFVAAGSSTGVTITVTALDANNNPEVGDTLKLVAGSGASTISPSATQVANSSGVAIFTVKDNTTQNVTYTASDTTDAVTFTTTPTVTFDTGAISASLSTVSANLTSVAANGTTKSTITVTAKEANNTGIANDTITLAAGSGSSLITTVSGVTNASGVATFTVTDNTAQAVVYTATDITQTPPSTGVAITQTTTVTFTPDSASSSQSTATTNTGFVQNNGIASATITVTVKDSGGAPISNQVVTLAHTGSAVVTTVSGTTNSLGVATFTVTDTAFENVTFTATDNTGTAVIIGQQPTVFF